MVRHGGTRTRVPYTCDLERGLKQTSLSFQQGSALQSSLELWLLELESMTTLNVIGLVWRWDWLLI